MYLYLSLECKLRFSVVFSHLKIKSQLLGKVLFRNFICHFSCHLHTLHKSSPNSFLLWWSSTIGNAINQRCKIVAVSSATTVCKELASTNFLVKVKPGNVTRADPSISFLRACVCVKKFKKDSYTAIQINIVQMI